MFDFPKTKEEALGYRYGIWADNRRGIPYQADQCAAEVATGNWFACQCARAPGHGPAALYCERHAAKIAWREARQVLGDAVLAADTSNKGG